jgi:hypothetical protein
MCLFLSWHVCCWVMYSLPTADTPKRQRGQAHGSLLLNQFASSCQLPAWREPVKDIGYSGAPCWQLQLLVLLQVVRSTDLGVAQLAADTGWWRQEPSAEPLHPRAVPLCKCEGVLLQGAWGPASVSQQPALA